MNLLKRYPEVEMSVVEKLCQGNRKNESASRRTVQWRSGVGRTIAESLDAAYPTVRISVKVLNQKVIKSQRKITW